MCTDLVGDGYIHGTVNEVIQARAVKLLWCAPILCSNALPKCKKCHQQPFGGDEAAYFVGQKYPHNRSGGMYLHSPAALPPDHAL